MAVVHTVFNQCKRFARSLPAKNRNYVLAMANAVDVAANSSTNGDLVFSMRESGAALGATSAILLANYTGDKVTRTISLYLTDAVGRIHEWFDGLTATITVSKSSTNGLISLTDTYTADTSEAVTFVRGVATFPVYIRNTRGFQLIEKTGAEGGSSDTGLSPETAYAFKIAYNGGTAVAKTITTGAGTVTYTALLALLNASTTGYATWSTTTNHIKCTSDSDAATSAIAITAPTTGTDLFTTTGLNATIETATARASIADHDTFTIVVANGGLTLMGATVASIQNVTTVHTALS